MLSEGDTEGRLTCGRNMEFVNGSLGIEESTLVEKIVAGIAVVGDLSLDLGVSERGVALVSRLMAAQLAVAANARN
jgi:hypothetical protein